MKIEYPTRCQIVEIPNGSIVGGLIVNTPRVSLPHIGKYGLAEEVNNGIGQKVVKITLDDGNMLYGYQCWWIPLEDYKEADHETPD